MKKYLSFALCVFITMYVAADDSNRSQVKSTQSPTEKQGAVVNHTQDNRHVTVGDGKVGMDVIQISDDKGRVMDPTNPVIQGGGVHGRPTVPVVPGRPGTKSVGGIKLPDFFGSGLRSESAAEGITGPTGPKPSFLPQSISISGGMVVEPLGGGLIVRPPRPGSWGDLGVIDVVTSRDDEPVIRPFIVPIGVFGVTQLYGNATRRSPATSVNDAPVMLGDVNEDGKVDMQDVTDMISHVKGQTPERFNIRNARVAGGSEYRSVDVNDVTALIDCVMNGTLPTE